MCFPQVPRGEVQLSRHVVLGRVRSTSLEKGSLWCSEGTCFPQVARGEVQLSRHVALGRVRSNSERERVSHRYLGVRSNFLGKLVLRRVRPNSLEKGSLWCREGRVSHRYLGVRSNFLGRLVLRRVRSNSHRGRVSHR